MNLPKNGSEEKSTMGMSEHIKNALKAKKLKIRDLAEMTDTPEQTLYNAMSRDSVPFKTVEMYADAIGCDIIFRNRETGEEY